MEALSLKDNPEATNKKGKAPALRPERCLGCGICVYKCPTQSLILERRETISHPPKTVQEWMGRWLEDRKAGASGKGPL
jgi:formate hydrogenlyase subunit 6/NADH:ubiquinone oxidoreductase subunit I